MHVLQTRSGRLRCAYPPQHRAAARGLSAPRSVQRLVVNAVAPGGAGTPRLPPRPRKADGSAPQASPPPTSTTPASSSSSRGGTARSRRRRPAPLPPGGGFEPQQPASERALAGMLAFTGLLGSVAVGLSMLSGGSVDVWGHCHWDVHDVALGLQLMAPVYVANVLILLPSYSSWTLPDMSPAATQQLADALNRWSSRSGGRNKGRSGSAGTAEAGAGAAAAGAEQAQLAAAEAPAASPGPSSSSPGPSSSTPSPSPSGGTSGGSGSGLPAWLAAPLGSPAALRLRDALFIAQGHYVSQCPALLLPPGLAVLLLGAECVASELLYRSVALQLGGGWLSDRLTEAGCEELLHAAAAGLPPLPTHTAGQLAALGVMGGATAVAVLQRVARASRRPLLLVQGRQTAGQLLHDLAASAARGDAQPPPLPPPPQQQPEDSDAPAPAPAPSTSTSSSSSSPAGQPVQAPPPSRSRAAADLALAAAAGQQVPAPWSRRLPRTLTALSLGQLVQGVRDLGQMTALGLAFILTGNLAAPLGAALVNTALMTALQKHGSERARQRSIAIARQIAGVARQLRDVQRKQQAAAAAAAAEPAEQAPAVAAAAAVVEQAAAAPALAADAAATAPAVLHASVESGGSSQALPQQQGQEHQEATVAPEPASSMDRTMHVLDSLLGQLGEHAPAGK